MPVRGKAEKKKREENGREENGKEAKERKKNAEMGKLHVKSHALPEAFSNHFHTQNND